MSGASAFISTTAPDHRNKGATGLGSIPSHAQIPCIETPGAVLAQPRSRAKAALPSARLGNHMPEIL
jgi:hypothetical protein